MVYLDLPEQLTAEEKALKKKYELLRRRKKALQSLQTQSAPKRKPPSQKPLVRPLEAKPDAKEVAKKLLKSGAISVIKVENKERQVFKRPKASQRKRNACKLPNTSATGYQPSPASHSLDEDPPSNGSPSDSASGSRRPPVKKLYENFVSSRKLEDEIMEDRARDNRRREYDRDGRPEKSTKSRKENCFEPRI